MRTSLPSQFVTGCLPVSWYRKNPLAVWPSLDGTVSDLSTQIRNLASSGYSACIWVNTSAARVPCSSKYESVKHPSAARKRPLLNALV